jgi:signal transduction histidine kinase
MPLTAPTAAQSIIISRVNTFRSESLKYCLAFTLLIGVALLYAGIWSLHTGSPSDNILVSNLDISLWIVCGLNLVGGFLGSFYKDRSAVISGWILSLFEGCAVFLLVSVYFNPYYIFGFIIPILFAVILLEWKQSAAFIGMVVVASFYLYYLHFQSWSFFTQISFPILLLISISVLIAVSLNHIHANLNWYYRRYQTALVNEQIIRDNEVKLEKLVNSLKDYEKYLSQTNNSLIKALDEAEQARTVKQNFVQNVSHELRTPLNMIIGFSETMINSPQSYGEVKWTRDLRGDIECIYQNSQHLKNLIDDILDMASLENRKYEIVLSNVELNAIIEEVVLITQSAYRSKGLSLEIDLSSRIQNVRGDAIRLKQVMLNLLSNALKYTKTGGVKITSTLEGKMACVTVSDTGKGIPKEDIGNVFEAFFQVDRSNIREDSGTGLGLYISKQLIERHGGEMSISSELGKGTTVFFSVPLVAE